MIILQLLFTILYVALVVFFAIAAVLFFMDRYLTACVAGVILFCGAVFCVGPYVLEIWGLWRVG